MSQLAKAQTANEIRRLGNCSHDVQRFLDGLRTRPDATREEIARREYQALPLLGTLNARHLTLHTFMAENPTFFVEVLCEAFLLANREHSEQAPQPSPEARARAQVAY